MLFHLFGMFKSKQTNGSHQTTEPKMLHWKRSCRREILTSHISTDWHSKCVTSSEDSIEKKKSLSLLQQTQFFLSPPTISSLKREKGRVSIHSHSSSLLQIWVWHSLWSSLLHYFNASDLVLYSTHTEHTDITPGCLELYRGPLLFTKPPLSSCLSCNQAINYLEKCPTSIKNRNITEELFLIFTSILHCLLLDSISMLSEEIDFAFSWKALDNHLFFPNSYPTILSFQYI